MRLLENRTAIVTGAARGIGRATALIFARHGAKVAMVDTDDGPLHEALQDVHQAGPGAITLSKSVAVAAQVQELVDLTLRAFGKVDVLVNNVGASWGAIGMDVSEVDFSDIIDLNLKSHFLCTRAVVPHMKQQKYGRIVNIAGDAGRFSSRLNGLPSVAANAGVQGQTRLLAQELGPFNITVNAVSPGNLRAEGSEDDFGAGIASAEALTECPLGRRTKMEEVAGAVLFFASDLSSHVTGVTISVNGGRQMLW
jgi:3-oxoacyl-[acyl-carrier protein] reductase